MNSPKLKIYVVLAAWLVACGVMLGYFFNILDKSNDSTLQKISELKKERAVLEAEQDSFILAKQDLRELSEQALLPKDFFSRDVTLVEEIRALEALGEKYKVNFELTGLSGTVKPAPKAKAQGNLIAVPYGIRLNGDFARVVDFIETLENLHFITTVNIVNLSSAGSTVSASMSAYFHVRK